MGQVTLVIWDEQCAGIKGIIYLNYSMRPLHTASCHSVILLRFAIRLLWAYRDIFRMILLFWFMVRVSAWHKLTFILLLSYDLAVRLSGPGMWLAKTSAVAFLTQVDAFVFSFIESQAG